MAVATTPLALQAGDQKLRIVLHTVDGLRQSPRAPGLTSEPRSFYGTIEIPQAVLDDLDSYHPALRALIRDRLQAARFTGTDVTVTDQSLTIAHLDMALNRT
ncbi:hypothetical protein [Embleya sp. NBC_00896]|uniref:hypothetical protein n=1 Tax=Embleya sp. NBC_00896 TaxID=2975961 RepID=UPI002F90DFDB|nr:hypothetical protein OG928_34480 [Embleya sp. NBC_00896]